MVIIISNEDATQPQIPVNILSFDNRNHDEKP